MARNRVKATKVEEKALHGKVDIRTHYENTKIYIRNQDEITGVAMKRIP